jgi:hypothetical protein
MEGGLTGSLMSQKILLGSSSSRMSSNSILFFARLQSQVCYACFTGTEDRAPVETDPSAVPVTEAERAAGSRPLAPAVPFPVRLWCECDKFRGSGGRAPSDALRPAAAVIFRPGNNRAASNVAPRATA